MNITFSRKELLILNGLLPSNGNNGLLPITMLLKDGMHVYIAGS